MDLTPIAALASIRRVSAFLLLDVSSAGAATNGPRPGSRHLRFLIEQDRWD
jgi:hypothetical protein